MVAVKLLLRQGLIRERHNDNVILYHSDYFFFWKFRAASFCFPAIFPAPSLV